MESRDTMLTDGDLELEQEQAERLSALRASEEANMLTKVLSTVEGRHVLFNILAKGDIYNLSGVASYGLAESQREIGRREIALEVLQDILTLNRNTYILMQQEAGAFEDRFSLTRA